jgi:hypothetical protein
MLNKRITILTGRMPLVEQELLTISENLSSPLYRSKVLFVCFVDRCLSLCPLSFGHCVVCSQILITPLVSSKLNMEIREAK